MALRKLKTKRPKNAAAQALVNMRWRRTSKADRSRLGRELAEARWGKQTASSAAAPAAAKAPGRGNRPLRHQ